MLRFTIISPRFLLQVLWHQKLSCWVGTHYPISMPMWAIPDIGPEQVMEHSLSSYTAYYLMRFSLPRWGKKRTLRHRHPRRQPDCVSVETDGSRWGENPSVYFSPFIRRFLDLPISCNRYIRRLHPSSRSNCYEMEQWFCSSCGGSGLSLQWVYISDLD